MPAGRPTDYKPEYCEMLIEHMKGGLSFEAFGGIADCSEQTLYNWREEYPEFLESYKKGVSYSLKHWEEMGHDMVLAGQGNSATWIFNMKNRFKWKDRHDVTTNDNELKGLVSVNYGNQETDQPLPVAGEGIKG
jgi:hypothetical protein